MDDLLKYAGVVALAVSIFNVIRAFFDRSTDRKRKVHDDFLIQKILFPQCVEPLIKALQGVISWCEKVGRSPTPTQTSEMFDELQRSLQDGASKLTLLTIVDVKLYDKFCAIHYRVEDEAGDLLAGMQQPSLLEDQIFDGEVPEVSVQQLGASSAELMREAVEAIIEKQRDM